MEKENVSDNSRSSQTKICSMCGKPASLKCSRCKDAVYCDKECQLSHWKYHKSMCKILGMRNKDVEVGAKEREFWDFFQENEEMLYNFEQNRPVASEMVYSAIHRVHPDLSCDFETNPQDGSRTFMITANGIKKVFPAVEALYKAAPERLNKRWKICKYRQRTTIKPAFKQTYNTSDQTYQFMTMEMAVGSIQPRPAIRSTTFLNGGRTIVTQANKIYFKLFMQNNYEQIGIMLFIDGIDDEEEKRGMFGGMLQELSVTEHLKQIGFLWLDLCLGEFDVEMHVGHVSFFSHESEHFDPDHVQPIFMLAKAFDEQLEWNRRNPSRAVRPDGDPNWW